MASLNYTLLYLRTIHIRVFSDGSFQNLHNKHFQIGLIIALADNNGKVNIAHWHSSRASRRPISTGESELPAFDLALNGYVFIAKSCSNFLEKKSLLSHTLTSRQYANT